MKVLSLFDGMSCAQLALKRAGVPVTQYFAAEIDKHAIKVTQTNFPDTIQLGSVTEIKGADLEHIDILIGGSPCQGFSFAGKGLNFDDERSKLFFEFVRIKNELQAINPNLIFLLENVRMKKEHELVISHYAGVQPVCINSALVSAQNRVRLYWTNIKTRTANLFGDLVSDIPQPEDKGILLKDILEAEVDKKYYLSEKMLDFVRGPQRLQKKFTQIDGEKGLTQTGGQFASWNGDFVSDTAIYQRPHGNNNGGLVAQNGKASSMTISAWADNNYLVERTVKQINPSLESGGKQPYQQNRIYDVDGIAPALCAEMSSGTHAIIEPFLATNRCKFNEPAKRIYTDKAPTLVSNETGGSTNPFVNNIRRLTPVECERLQTVPDNYTAAVSDSQRYKMLGNGFTVDVIAHILKCK